MKKLIYTVLICLTMVLMIWGADKQSGRLEKNDAGQSAASDIAESLAETCNAEGVTLMVNGNAVDDDKYSPYISAKLTPMLTLDTIEDKLGCEVSVYVNGSIIISRNDKSVRLVLGQTEAEADGSALTLTEAPVVIDDQTYVPVCDIGSTLGYKCEYNYDSNRLTCMRTEEDSALPTSYDMRGEGRTTSVRDQGDSGTCWAFASLAALETVLMPDENLQFSVDNMTKNNGFGSDQLEGGQYRMSIAYLASWEGPVLEEDDPYGDDETDSSLEAVKHLQEAQILPEGDLTAIKEAVYQNGGVETAIYCDMTDADSNSDYYNSDTYAYYYDGSEGINHDIVIVGWDDSYSSEKFNTQPEGDGAFICKNSWGTDFGDDGYFYVSYYDVHIGETSVVYTSLEPNDNYDRIYQSDQLGWVGVLGYESEEAYFANAYTASEGEELAAVSFYATGAMTTYEVYVVTDFTDADSLSDRTLVASGEMENAGYYTVQLASTVSLADNAKYAVVVHITTPDAEYPIAIEYDADAMTDSFDKSDGEGYISLYGNQWSRAEDERDCNVCLKAFTNAAE